jgi:hypothetical protein
MAEMSLEYQIQRVSDLKQYLETTTILIEKLKYEMQTKIPYLTEHGLPVEIATKYKSHYLSNLYMNMDKLKNRVLTDDTGYLNDVIVHLTNAINR